ncbi:MAG: hypothetical protein V4599_10645 [Verrucomicrobiota bacterium]
MKTLIVSFATALLLAVSAQASVLGRFDFNHLAGVNAANEASFISPCIDVTDLDACCLNEGLRSSGGPDGSAFRTYSGWDRNQYDSAVYLNRSGLWQWPKTLAFEVQASATSQGAISGLSVDVKRPYAYSPDTIMASIFWEDATGTIQQRNSGPVSIASASGWTTLDFDFANGSAELPSGVEYSGETFNVELYAWGGTGGALYLDNVTLTGDCAPIPEPGGAMLIGMSGLALLLRRRSRWS